MATTTNKPKYRVDPLKHQGLVRNIARQYIDRGLDLDDLIGEAQLGLLHACRWFDEDRDLQFSTYATYCIRGSILRALRNNDQPIPLPHYLYDLIAKVERGELDLASLPKGRRELVVQAMRVRSRLTTSDAAVLANLQAPDGREVERREAVEITHSMLATSLTPQQRRDAQLWLDHLGNHPQTNNRHIGDKMGVTRERARQRLHEVRQTLRKCYPEGVAS